MPASVSLSVSLRLPPPPPPPLLLSFSSSNSQSPHLFFSHSHTFFSHSLSCALFLFDMYIVLSLLTFPPDTLSSKLPSSPIHHSLSLSECERNRLTIHRKGNKQCGKSELSCMLRAMYAVIRGCLHEAQYTC